MVAPSCTGHLLPPPACACTLPYDLVLEIVARSDVATVVRSAATCKPLRRDILSPAFIRRLCHHGPNGGGVVPQFLVGYLRVHSHSHSHSQAGEKQRASCFSLVHPATPAAASFSEDHLAPFLSHRAAADLNGRFTPVTSRNGLAVLRRDSSRIYVYDPMTGDRAYLQRPLDICRHGLCAYDLLTAADGIGCSFLLLAADMSVSCIQAAWSSDIADRTWGWRPLIYVAEPDRHRGNVSAMPHSDAVVLDGLVHWLMCIDMWQSPPSLYILTYDVPRHGTPAATTTGSIDVPKACLPDKCRNSDVHLTTLPDGKLSLLVADRFTISVWLLCGSDGSAGRWARKSVIDTEAIVRSVSPHYDELPQSDRRSKVDFVSSSAGLRSGAVLLRPFMSRDLLNDKGEKGLLLLDVGSEEMRRVNKEEGFPYEVDMDARLSALKIFD